MKWKKYFFWAYMPVTIVFMKEDHVSSHLPFFIWTKMLLRKCFIYKLGKQNVYPYTAKKC